MSSPSTASKRLTRRRFLAVMAGLAGGVAASSLPLAACGPVPAPVAGPFTARQRATLDAVGRVFWPDLPGQPGAGGVDAAGLAAELFAHANARLLGDLRAALDAIEGMTWLRGHLTPFTGLDPAAQAAYLGAWRDGWLPLQHRAYAGLVRLTGMLTYMRPAAWPAIHYPGPWIGRIDIGLGPTNQGAMAASPNPNVFVAHDR